MAVAYEKETGKRVWFRFEIDRRQAIDFGTHTAEPPEDAKSEEEIALDAAGIQKVAGIAERDRLGEVILPEEREKLNEFQTNTGLDTPGSPPGVAAPEPVLAVDTFNPATASRSELFGYLRERGDEIPNAISTDHLRERVYLKIGSTKPKTSAG